jgi:hypothetical protein
LINAESVAHGLDACPVSQRCKEQECQVCRTEPRARRRIVRARETHSVAELDNRDELPAACFWTGEQPVKLQPNAIRSRDGDSSSNNHCGGRKGERRRCLSTTRLRGQPRGIAMSFVPPKGGTVPGVGPVERKTRLPLTLRRWIDAFSRKGARGLEADRTLPKEAWVT